MAYTTVDHAAPLSAPAMPPLFDESADAALAEAQAVLDRHSRFTTNPQDSGFCADCVQNNLCDDLTRANALILRDGIVPRRRSRSRTASVMREVKRREDSWLSE